MKKLTRNQVLTVRNEIKKLNNKLISAQPLNDIQRVETVKKIVADIDLLIDFIICDYNDALIYEEIYEACKKKIGEIFEREIDNLKNYYNDSNNEMVQYMTTVIIAKLDILFELGLIDIETQYMYSDTAKKVINNGTK